MVLIRKRYRHVTLPVDYVLGTIKESIGTPTHFRVLYDKKVKIKTRKLLVFLKYGVKCVTCGLEATHFALETDPKDPSGYWFLSLYGVKDGREIEFTMDHILPRSKGGVKEGFHNLQPMCYCCNQKKGNTVDG